MCANGQQDVGILFYAKSQAVVHGNAGFPNVFLTFVFFDPERRVIKVL